jgi:hypothetical protein
MKYTRPSFQSADLCFYCGAFCAMTHIPLWFSDNILQVIDMAAGGDRVCLHSDGVRHFEKIDYRILSLFADPELRTYLIPALIPGDVLARCGCFQSFPHQLMAVATLYGDDRKAFADGGEVRLQSFVVHDRQAGTLQ